MKNFLILIREDIARMEDLTEADFQNEITEFTAWVEQLAATNNFVQGDPLTPEGRYLRKEEVHSDGPFIEAKEAVSGYVMVRAEDLDQAVALAQGCPIFKYGGALEVREIMQV